MKTKDLLQLLAIVLLGFTLMACEEEGDGAITITETAVTFDGTKYVMDNASIESFEEHGDMMMFIDASNDDVALNISLYNYTGKGTYTLSESSEMSQGHLHLLVNNTSYYFKDISVVIIDDTEGSISGTFAGTVHSAANSETGIELAGTFVQGDEPEETSSMIPTTYLNESNWTSTYLVYYDDATMGFDFSLNNYVDTERDGYLDRSTLAFINSFLFEGVNHLYKFSSLDAANAMEIPAEWDSSNSQLQVGNYYLVECKDGYALFKVLSYMDCCGEFEISHSFVPTSAIAEE